MDQTTPSHLPLSPQLGLNVHIPVIARTALCIFLLKFHDQIEKKLGMISLPLGKIIDSRHYA